MKNLFILFLVLFIYPISYAQQWLENLPDGKTQSELTLTDYKNAFDTYWKPFDVDNGYYFVDGEKKKAFGWKQFNRWYWEMKPKVNPKTGEFPTQTAQQVYDEYIKANPNQMQGKSANWTSLGPTSSEGGYAGIGRLDCIAFHPTDNNTYWVGSPSGGLWKTNDNGSSWTCLTDDNGVLGISDIAIPSDYATSQTIYIATGDRDGSYNNSIGVLKSTDGGLSWNTTDIQYALSNMADVSRLLIDPNDNQTIIAATSYGVYKTTNGGDNWSNQLFDVSFIDMEYKPGDFSVLYGSTKYDGKIYLSANSGSSWSNVFYNGKRIELAVSPDNSSYVYALVSNSQGGLNGVYRSDNSGASFSQMAGSNPNLLHSFHDGSGSGGQGSYDLSLAVSPNDANIVFVGGINTWKSTNGGSSWSIVSHWSGDGGVQEVHADKHKLIFRQNGDLFECNDGGVYSSNNNGSSGSWVDKTNGMVISHIYEIGVSQTVNNESIAGLQDNGTKLKSGGTWNDVFGGDGMNCLIDYTDVNIQYASYQNGQMFRTINHWASVAYISPESTGPWVTPYIIDPNDHNTLYAGYHDVWKTTNKGDSWTKISNFNYGSWLKSLAIAPSDNSVLYVAGSFNLWKTTNGGASWTDVTGVLSDNYPIQKIAVKSDDPNTVWVTLGGYDVHSVYQTINGGSSWTDISAGLPAIPAYSVVQNSQITNEVHLYLATELGVYFKNGIDNWIEYNSGLPNVSTREVEIYYDANPSNSKLRLASWGRGLWESDLEGQNSNSSPVVINPIDNVTLSEGFETHTINISNVFNDPDGDALSYSVVSSNTSVVGASVSGAILSITENNNGSSVITLSANDGNGGEANDMFTVTVSASSFNPPLNLSVTEEGYATWDAPSGGGSFDPEWIGYSVGEITNSIGTGEVADFDVAARFTPAELSGFENGALTKLSFVPGEDGALCTYTLKVWTGSGEPTLLYSQEVTSIVADEWNEIVLNPPVPFDNTEELWFGFNCNTTTGHPAGCDDGPEVEGFGNMIYWEGAWTTLTALSSTLTYNWAVEGYIEAAGSKAKLTPATQKTSALIANVGTLSERSEKMAPAAFFAPETNRALIGYNLYLDDVMVDNIVDLFYQYVNLTQGESYIGGVSAVYDEGESEIVEYEFTVPESSTLSVTPSNQNVSSLASNISFTVISNSEWTASSDASWCNVTSSGNGNGTLTATYEENLETTTRIAIITVSVDGTNPVQVTLTQEGANHTLSVTPSNQNVSPESGNINFTITTNSEWTAISDVSWCNVTSSGNGNGTLIATYEENSETITRIAIITVSVDGTNPVQVNLTQEGAAPTLLVTPSNQNVSSESGNVTFAITTNSEWTAISNASWCNVTSSGNGDGTLTATYEENSETTTRIAIINVSVTGLEIVPVTVTQYGTNPTLTVTPSNQNVNSLAGNTSFTVNTNSDWTADCDVSWCSITSSGSGTGTLEASYEENTETLTRVATITVIVSDSDPVQVTIIQDGANPILSVTPSNQNTNSNSGNTNYTITSNSDWTASVDVSWCSITSSGSGSGTISANYDENESTVTRVATITVTVSGLSPILVTLTQAGATPFLEVTPAIQYVDFNIGTAIFSVNSNSVWTAISNVEWCTVTPSGDGNGVITANYEANYGPNDRTASISVYVTDVPTIDVFIEQSLFVGLRSNESNNLQIIPNPSTGLLKVTLTDKQEINEIQIKDLTGKNIFWTKGLNKIDHFIDLSNNSQGCYIIKVKTIDETIISRIIINR